MKTGAELARWFSYNTLQKRKDKTTGATAEPHLIPNTTNSTTKIFLPENGLSIWLPSQISLKYFYAGESSHVDVWGLNGHQIALRVLCYGLSVTRWPGLSSPTEGCEQNVQRFWKKAWEVSSFFLSIRSNGSLANHICCWWSRFSSSPGKEYVCSASPKASFWRHSLQFINNSYGYCQILPPHPSFLRPEGKVKISWWGPLGYLGDGTLKICIPTPSLFQTVKILELPEILFSTLLISSKLSNISLKYWQQNLWKGFGSETSIIILLFVSLSLMFEFSYKKKGQMSFSNIYLNSGNWQYKPKENNGNVNSNVNAGIFPPVTES